MADQSDATSAEVDASATEDDAATAQELLADAVEAGGGDPEGADQLGDAGKKALDAMKAKWQKEREARKALQSKLDDAAKPKDDEQADPEKLREQAKTEARAELMRERVLDKIEAKAAKGFTDPEDAAALVLRGREVDEFLDDGKVDVEAIQEALDELLQKKPYLAAQGGKRFQGTADGGARNGKSKPSQLTREDVKRLAAEGKHKEIEKAREEGRLTELLSGKQ